MNKKVEKLRREGIKVFKERKPPWDLPVAMLPPCDKSYKYEVDEDQRDLAVVFVLFDGAWMAGLRNSLTWAAYSLARFTDVSDKGIPIFLAVEPSIMDSVQVYLDLIPDHPYKVIPLRDSVGNQHTIRFLWSLAVCWQKELRDYRQVLVADVDGYFIPGRSKETKLPLTKRLTSERVRDGFLTYGCDWVTNGCPYPQWSGSVMGAEEYAETWASVYDLNAVDLERALTIDYVHKPIIQCAIFCAPMGKLRETGEDKWFERSFKIGGTDEGVLFLYAWSRNLVFTPLSTPDMLGNVYGSYVKDGVMQRQIPNQMTDFHYPQFLLNFQYPDTERAPGAKLDHEQVVADFMKAME